MKNLTPYLATLWSIIHKNLLISNAKGDVLNYQSYYLIRVYRKVVNLEPFDINGFETSEGKIDIKITNKICFMSLQNIKAKEKAKYIFYWRIKRLKKSTNVLC